MEFNEYWNLELSGMFQGQLIVSTPELAAQKATALKAWYAALKVGNPNTNKTMRAEKDVDLFITDLYCGSNFYAAPDLLTVSYTKAELNALASNWTSIKASCISIDDLGSYDLYDEYQAVLTTGGIDFTHQGQYYMTAEDRLPIRSHCTKLHNNGTLQLVIYLDEDPGEVWADLGNLNEILKGANARV